VKLYDAHAACCAAKDILKGRDLLYTMAVELVFEKLLDAHAVYNVAGRLCKKSAHFKK